MPMVDDGLPAACQVERIRKHLLELLLLRDDVVGRQHGHHAGGGPGADQRSAERHRGAGVASDRLGDDILPSAVWAIACAPQAPGQCS